MNENMYVPTLRPYTTFLCLSIDHENSAQIPGWDLLAGSGFADPRKCVWHLDRVSQRDGGRGGSGL